MAIVRSGVGGTAGRKRLRVNGVGRRANALESPLRVVVFAPEEMLLVAGSPGLRRAAIDQLASAAFPGYASALATYGRTLQQRNGLLRAIREEGASRDELRFWDGAFLDAGGRIVADRLRLLEQLAGPIAAAHAEIAPDEAAAATLGVRYSTNAPAAPGETPHGTPWPAGSWRPRTRRSGTGRRSSVPIATTWSSTWRAATWPASRRAASSGRRSCRSSSPNSTCSRRSTATRRSCCSTTSSPSSTPSRRSHLVRRIAELPQAFVTTTTLDDLDPALRAIATTWEVRAGPDGARLEPDPATAGRA